MKRTAFIITVFSTALALTAAAAIAKNRGPDFSILDMDGNGEITIEEMQASAQSRFDEVDTDGDGFVSQAELAAHSNARAAERAERMISRMDADDDGKLSPEEMMHRRNPERFFSRMDTDDSGSISAEEFKEARGGMKDRGRHRKHAD
ncbi:EF-hand domain-containing protein [Tateyamaria pelophila]|uniref:EF-hand domain-containing protein n=1 Tax=Tateyamaria pelophila TaxID=328415 RepID=UPI001CBE96D8|nr:EF-hand domain-containing protein [Tateyamaria pelophila]